MSLVRFTRDHEWIRLDGDLAVVGVEILVQVDEAADAQGCRLRLVDMRDRERDHAMPNRRLYIALGLGSQE